MFCSRMYLKFIEREMPYPQNYSKASSEFRPTTASKLDRAYKINNTWLGFHEDITKVTKILQKNLFPVHLVANVINRYLTFTRQDCNPPASVSDTTRTFYFINYLTLSFLYYVTQKSRAILLNAIVITLI